MKQLHFRIEVNAPKERVWNVLWDDQGYRNWTSVFSEGSYAISDWQEGSKIKFLSPDGNGMYSVIEKKIDHELMSFKHLGVIKGEQEQEQDEETKSWSGAKETYTLTENQGTTELTVTMDITEPHEKYFQDTFPKALDRVKALAENGIGAIL